MRTCVGVFFIFQSTLVDLTDCTNICRRPSKINFRSIQQHSLYFSQFAEVGQPYIFRGGLVRACYEVPLQKFVV